MTATEPHTVADLILPWRDHLFLREGAERWSLSRAWQGPRSVLLDAVLAGGRRALVGLGDPAALAEFVVDALTCAAAPALASLARGTWQHVDGDTGERSGLRVTLDWDWLACESAPPNQAGEERVAPVERPEERAEVARLLALAYPSEWSRPSEAHGYSWWCWRDDDGTILGAAGARALSPGGPVRLGGIATHPAARRRGIASALTAAVAREALAQAPWVSLAIRGDNDAARNVYLRLGFRVEVEFETLRPESRSVPDRQPRVDAT